MRVGVLGFGFDRRASRVPWRWALQRFTETTSRDLSGCLARYPSPVHFSEAKL